MAAPLAHIVRAANAALLNTEEALTIPLDYDVGGGGSVGDPPAGTVFTKQSDIDDLLTVNSWTAFKHIEAVYGALPPFIGHAIIFNCAAGEHRPLPGSDGWPLNTKTLIDLATVTINGVVPSAWVPIDASLVNLTVQSFVAQTDPSLTFSGTPFLGFDLRGYHAVLSTGQTVLIYEHTDSTIKLPEELTPSPTGATVTVARPGTQFHNTQDGVTQDPNGTFGTFVTSPNVSDTNFVNFFFINDIEVDSFGGHRGFAHERGSAFYTRCIREHTVGPSENGSSFVISNGFAGYVSCSRVARGSSAADTCLVVGGGVGGVSFGSLQGCVFVEGEDGILIGGANSSAGFTWTILDACQRAGSDIFPAAVRLADGGWADFNNFGNGKLNEIRNLPTGTYAITLIDGGHLRRGVDPEILIKDCADGVAVVNGAQMITSNGFTVGPGPEGPTDGGGNTGIGIDVVGPHCLVDLGSATDVTGTVGDVRFSDGTIRTYAQVVAAGQIDDPAFDIVKKV